MLALVTFEQFANAYMDWAGRFTPLKFDYFLQLIDKNLGVSAFSVARLFSAWQVSLLLLIYLSLIRPCSHGTGCGSEEEAAGRTGC
jgi:hypothetical protein